MNELIGELESGSANAQQEVSSVRSTHSHVVQKESEQIRKIEIDGWNDDLNKLIGELETPVAVNHAKLDNSFERSAKLPSPEQHVQAKQLLIRTELDKIRKNIDEKKAYIDAKLKKEKQLKERKKLEQNQKRMRKVLKLLSFPLVKALPSPSVAKPAVPSPSVAKPALPSPSVVTHQQGTYQLPELPNFKAFPSVAKPALPSPSDATYQLPELPNFKDFI
jgi:hypothetical protein